MPPLIPHADPVPGKPLPGAGQGGRPTRSHDARRRWTIPLSLLLHAMVVAALLTVRRPEPPSPVAPSYDLVFENGGSSTPPTAETIAPDTPSTPPADAPASDLPPVRLPEPPTPPESPPMETVAPEPAPPEPPAPLLPEPLPPEPLPPEPLPPESAPPPAAPEVVPEPAPAPIPVPEPVPLRAPPSTVRLTEPEPVPPPLTPQAMAPDLPALVPPPALPPAPPRPRVQAAPRPAPGTLGAPMDLTFGPSRTPAPRAPGSRGIDFALGAPKPGPNKSEAFFDIRAANIGADWAQGLAQYWRRHRYYPQQAAQNGEDGTVVIQIVVNRQGRVESVEIKSRSGSPWLDMAAVGTWRNAQLAPLPRENTDATITIPLTINYLLIR